MKKHRWAAGLIVGAALVLPVAAQTKNCSAADKAETSAQYDRFRNASRAGDLELVRALSTPEVARQIRDFEKSSPDKAALAQMMGGISPALADAVSVRCERSGDKARLIIHTETRSEDGKSVAAQVFSVVMLERTDAQWRVGVKATTNPFETQPLDTLLVHQALRLP